MSKQRFQQISRWPLRLCPCVPAPVLFFIVIFGLALVVQAAPQPQEELWVANGPVHAMVSNDDASHLFVDGEFSYRDPGTAAIAMDTSLGQFDRDFPHINGPVYALASDGAGGWYIGGQFSCIGGGVTCSGGAQRNNLAYIRWDADSWVIEDWNPDMGGAVYTLALAEDGSLLYVGGAFTTINGVLRRYLVALETGLTAAATAWDPGVSGVVRTLQLAADDAALYIGGDFIYLEGGTVRRNYAAAIDTVAADANGDANPGYGKALSWHPDVNAAVYTLLIDGGLVYLGGAFSEVNGNDFQRSHVVRVGLSDAVVDPAWDPAPNERVRVIRVAGTEVYLGGDFTELNSPAIAQAYLTVVDSVNGNTNGAWNPQLDAAVFSLLASPDGVLYVGGDFLLIDGQQRNRLAALDVNSGKLIDWRPDAWVTVRALGGFASVLVAGGGFDRDGRSLLYIGGDFDYVGPVTGSAVLLDDVAAQVDVNLPRLDGVVYAVVADGSEGWYIGGEFSVVGGQPRNNLAHIDKDGVLSDWAPEANATVRALSLSGSTLYVGGDFFSVDDVVASIGGQPRDYLAAIDVATGDALVGWDAGVDGVVRTLLGSAGVLYVGGDFNLIDGESRNYLAAIDEGTGDILVGWDANADGIVRALALSGDGLTLYVGGDFFSIGGQPRDYLAAITVATGDALSAWDAGIDGVVHALALAATRLYAGGDFTSVAAAATVRNHVAAFDSANGSVDISWDADANGIVRALGLSADNATLYVGGEFTLLANISRNRMAAIQAADGSLTDWRPSVGGVVHSLATQAADVFIGGAFASVGGKTRRNLAALELVSGQVSDWNPSINGEVRALMLSGTNIYVGGLFSATGSESRNNLALLDKRSGATLGWNPGSNGRVNLFSPSGNNLTVLVAGIFSQVAGQTRNGLAEIDVNGRVTAWRPALDTGADVRALSLSGSVLYLGGEFSISDAFSNVLVRDLAALEHPAAKLTAWRPVLNGAVNTLLLSADQTRVYIGGEFTEVDTETRARLAVLDPEASVAGDYVQDWYADANGVVQALALSRDRTTLFVGGEFTQLAGLGRERLGAIRAGDAAIYDEWVVAADAAVNTLLFSDDVLYAAGVFNTINAAPRPTLAALDALPVETSPPTTTASLASDNYNSNDLQSVTLLCDDDLGSGCATTYYSLDDGPWLLYGRPLELEGSAELRFFSIDYVGNSELGTVKQRSYTLEIVAPLTTISPTTGVYDTETLLITLSCSDDSSGCGTTYYTLDNSAPSEASLVYNGPFTIQGNVVVKYFSVDQEGNKETAKRASFVSTYSGAGSWDVVLLLMLMLMLMVMVCRRHGSLAGALKGADHA